MSRIAEKFSQLAQLSEGCLACYLMGGDPSLQFTCQAILRVAQAGADIIEVGIPFSEPIGDGPTIQAAGARALAAGTTPEGVLGAVAEVKQNCDVPVVIMTYYNIALRPGLREFAERTRDSGADGVILADLPVPEAGPWSEEAQRVGLDTIFLAAPTSTDDSLEQIGAAASGFVYCVSLMGVTGARDSLAPGVSELVARVKAHTSLPVLVGFGISSPAHVQQACEIAAGVVVGSALIDSALRHYDDPIAALKHLSEFVSDMKAATRAAQVGKPSLESRVQSHGKVCREAVKGGRRPRR